MAKLPATPELVQLLPVGRLPKQRFIIFFQLSDTFVFGHHLLEMTATLRRRPRLEKLGKNFKNLAHPNISKFLLSLVFGSKDVLVIINKDCKPKILLFAPLTIRTLPLFLNDGRIFLL